MWDLFISVQRVIHILCVSVQGVIIVLQVFLSRGSIWSSWGSLASAQKFILIFYHCLGRHYYFNFCPGGHYNLLFLSRGSQWFTISVQGVTAIYYFCPGVHSVFIFVWGVTMIYYFCPGGHCNLLFLSRGWFCFYFCLGGHCGPLCMSRGKSSILSSVLVERSSK